MRHCWKGLQSQDFTNFIRSCRANGMTISMNTQHPCHELDIKLDKPAAAALADAAKV